MDHRDPSGSRGDPAHCPRRSHSPFRRGSLWQRQPVRRHGESAALNRSLDVEIAVFGTSRPYLEPTGGDGINFPRSANAFAFTNASVEHVMTAGITFRPVTFLRGSVIFATDEEHPHVIVALAGHGAAGERQMHVHAMLVR